MRTKAILKKVILLSLIPIVVSGFGVLCNIIVMAANDGMPIKGNYGLTKAAYDSLSMPYPDHTGYWEGTKLKFLADVIPIGDRLHSMGDILIYAGFALWFVVIGVAIIRYFKDRQLPIKTNDQY